MKAYPCPQCREDVSPNGAEVVDCPDCGAHLAVDVDADWDSETGWRDLTTLRVIVEPLSPEDVKLNGMDQEVEDFKRGEDCGHGSAEMFRGVFHTGEGQCEACRAMREEAGQ